MQRQFLFPFAPLHQRTLCNTLSVLVLSLWRLLLRSCVDLPRVRCCVQSIKHHENGKKHKETVSKFFLDKKRGKLEEERKQRELDKELREIDKVARWRTCCRRGAC